MAGRLVSLVYRGAHGLDARTKLVLAIIAEHCRNEKSLAWPSELTIAAIANMGPRRVRDCIAQLLALGWIARVPGTGHGPKNPTKYGVDFAAMRGPETEFHRSKGRVCIVAKAADVRLNKPADVRRIWSEEKRWKLGANEADLDAKRGARRPEKRGARGTDEPVFNRY